MANYIHGDHKDLDNQLKLVDLPPDALFCIFKFCDSLALRNLSATCKRLRDVVKEDCVWLKQSKKSIITNQLSNEVSSRTLHKLRAKERCRISINWRYGCYGQKVYNTVIKYMPWLHLERGLLWISQGSDILGVQRLRDGLKMHSPLVTIQTGHTEDISRFVVTDQIIYSGGSDRLICGWSTTLKKPVLRYRTSHTQEILGIDCKRNILVSGSKDSTIKIWQVQEEGGSLTCAQTVNVSDRVWCVAINPSLTSIAVGSAGYHNVHPLQLYDLERGEELPLAKSMRRKGAAVFDIRWETPQAFLTCGHDSEIRLWDLRVSRCVSVWTDPFNAPGYCLATDQHYAILCGTSHYGRVQLWDKRSPCSVQAYFGQSVASSPVYSLGFDCNQLFLAQDSSINVLDFSRYYWPDSHCVDYSNAWK
uniref:F-box domain-containing protein n=1 Tax=Graphocephala atropunctata TaxID=36148 RepID=A0A1B6KIY8_9HEMI